QLTPNMRRITVGGQALADFPVGSEGGYIKLLFPTPDFRPADFSANDKPILRTYTIRHHRADKNELDIDFVVHGDSGVAAQWCQYAKPGNEIAFAGPGNLKAINTSADWFLFVADMAAMPAALAVLSTLPQTAVGTVFFEILCAEDQQPVQAPPGINIEWLVQSEPGREGAALIDKVRGLDFPTGEPGIFIAGEWKLATALRDHLRNDRLIDRKIPYISSYWKRGADEEAHKRDKKTF
ncbi:MAG: siderophore-interacting protein, partial [Sneathiella sp.]|nr:siderophore-interacting protein [Sneathiella sp.]